VLVALLAPPLTAYGWASYHEQAGRKALADGDFAGAEKHFECSLRLWLWSADLRLQAARAARMAGAYDRARDYLRASHIYGGAEDVLAIEHRLIRAQQGDLEEVESALLTDVWNDHPESVTILEVLVPLYVKNYRLGPAGQCIERWLAREPDRVEPWLYRARVCEYLHQDEEALESYRRVVEIQPDNDEARFVVAGLLIARNRTDEALEQFEWLRSRLGENPRVLVGMACCRRASSHPDEARALLDQALAQAPANPTALAERARLAAESESPAEAEKWFRKAVEAQPRDRDANYGLYQALQRLGKREEAAAVRTRLDRIDADLDELKHLTGEIAERPHDPEPRYKAGQVFLRSGQETEALRWLASALQEDPGHAPTHRLLADYYERKGDTERAATHRRLAAVPGS
jgi:Tfp pilus assembly protein PilF